MSGPAQIDLLFPLPLERQFKARAKEMFPKEAYAVLLGTVAGDSIVIDEVWMPPLEEAREFATGQSISSEGVSRWLAEANEHAKEEEMVIVGEVHSHPFSYRDTGGVVVDRVPSEWDLDAQVAWRPLVNGICTVQEQKGGRLRASLRMWGPTVGMRVRRK